MMNKPQAVTRMFESVMAKDVDLTHCLFGSTKSNAAKRGD
jgi:hypothetical protein